MTITTEATKDEALGGEAWLPPPIASEEVHRLQTLDTWQRESEHSLQLRRVDWPILLGDAHSFPVFSTPTHKQEDPNTRWLAVLSAFDDLKRLRDRSTLLRRAVELLRTEVGIERVAIFLRAEDQNQMVGTWGTGANGETTDEHHVVFELGQSHREAFAQAEAGVARWLRLRQVPLLAQTDKGTTVVRQGENVLIPIPGPNGSLGLLCCDGALSGRELEESTLMRAAVLVTLLGGLLASLGRQRKEQVGIAQGPGRQNAIPQAVRLLHADLGLSRDALAKQVGMSPGRFGKLFKSAMGESVAEYRNRLRLDRFMTLVDPQGGNLLQAALDSGFGSYAQFHRVFRANVGCSPRDYLARNNLAV